MARVTSPRAEQVGTAAPGWGVVVPVKHLDVAKSRLAVGSGSDRRALALAFAEDVVLAALACPAVGHVLVVTDDEDVAPALRALGAEVTGDRPNAGLDAALVHGEAVLRGADPALGVVAVSADLPALRADDLAEVLAATARRTVVADAQGTGTTLLAAAPGVALAPAYGPGSLARHLATGAVALPGPPGARRDVDTLDDLAEALRLGVGPRTAAVAAAVGLLARAAAPATAARHRAAPQGTMLP
jgi:2-phospho-L-lactate/phosphoenolpyruvate guanylyltransferase